LCYALASISRLKFNERFIVFKKLLPLVALALCALAPSVLAVSTDITGTVSELSVITDAAIVVGIVVLVFMVGRKLVRRII